MPRRKSFPELTSWLPEAKAQAVSALGKFVRCVAASGNQREFTAWASCVPVVFSAKPILLTAWHVLQTERTLWVESSSGFKMIPRDVLAFSDSADVAAIRLPDVALTWNIPFLVLDDQFVPRLTSGELEVFVAVGFPVRNSKVDIAKSALHIEPISYWSSEEPAAYQRLRVDKSQMIATKFDRKRSFRAGLLRAMRKPEGMSGGALWRLWDTPEQILSLRQASLAGIVVEYRDSTTKCMLSARLEVVQELARQVV